jgi:hypothetical protein
MLRVSGFTVTIQDRTHWKTLKVLVNDPMFPERATIARAQMMGGAQERHKLEEVGVLKNKPWHPRTR